MQRRHPLLWPPGWRRTQNPGPSKFNTGADKSLKNLLAEIARMGGTDVVISSNAQYRNDGMPFARQGHIADTGVAVYFKRKGRDVVFACDTYWHLHDNIHAIGLTIEALRTMQRHGASELMDRAFTGFEALPAPAAKRPWREVFEGRAARSPGEKELKDLYRYLAMKRHPDREGGSAVLFDELNRAYDEAKAELGVA